MQPPTPRTPWPTNLHYQALESVLVVPALGHVAEVLLGGCQDVGKATLLGVQDLEAHFVELLRVLTARARLGVKMTVYKGGATRGMDDDNGEAWGSVPYIFFFTSTWLSFLS